jgi:chromosome segregation ATPase
MPQVRNSQSSDIGNWRIPDPKRHWIQGFLEPKVLAELNAEARMSRLDLAKTRFRAALEALENASGSVGESLDQAAKLPERVAELEAERETLLARIAELEDEVAALSGLTEEVEGRLDGAMDEIRTALAR